MSNQGRSVLLEPHPEVGGGQDATDTYDPWTPTHGINERPDLPHSTGK